MRNVLDEGQGVGVVLSFGHTFGGKPGDGISSDVVVLECGFKLHNAVGEGPHGYGDSVLSERGCPSEGRSFGHVGEGEGDLFAVGVVDFLVDKKVELYCIQPLGGFVIGSIKGFWCSDRGFGGF